MFIGLLCMTLYTLLLCFIYLTLCSPKAELNPAPTPPIIFSLLCILTTIFVLVATSPQASSTLIFRGPVVSWVLCLILC